MKKILMLLICMMPIGMIQAQTLTISGKVLSSVDNQPLPGVSVMVEGTPIGTITSFEGTFTLQVPESSSKLIFSYVGMATQAYDIDFDNPGSIEIIMEQDFLDLDELIVTGYSTQVRNSLTGSTVQLKADDFKDIPVTSVDQALQGKVAGLTISTTSGTPGSIQNIRIRGVGSLTAGNEPLIVIDGVPVINQNFTENDNFSSLSSLASINSNDIETITVLKDASATSAYGARGSNGVIVITTKKGSIGKTQFNLAYSYGFQNKASQGHDVLTGAQREKLYLDGVYHSFGEDYDFTREEAFDWALANGFDGALLYDVWHAEGSPECNWEDAMRKKNAGVSNMVVSASGGDQASTFYVSAAYNLNEGTIVGIDFRRFSGTFNWSSNLHKRLKFSTSNKVSNTMQDKPILEQDAYYANPNLAKYFMPPIMQARNEDGSAKIDNPTIFFNWLYLKDNDIITNNMTRALTNNFLEWEILDHLKFKTLLSMDYIIADFKQYANRHYGDGAYVNGGSYRSMTNNLNLVFQNSLAYNLYMSDHSLQFIALMEYQVNNRHKLNGYGENYATDNLSNINQTSANWQAGSEFTDWMNLSYLGMINYNYEGKYIVDATYRREGSSKFARDRRYGNFWSVGTAWNMSQEAFLAHVEWLNNLRARISYGVSGNSDVGINRYQALLSYDANYAAQGAAYPGEFGNTLLTWEKNANLDIGLDFGALEGRISGSFSYFNKETSDLLQDVPFTRTSGHARIIKNVGTVINKGVEGILNIDIMRRSDLNISISTNFATLDNEVKELARDANGEDINIETSYQKIETGHPVLEWHMRKWAGVDASNGDPLWFTDSESNTTTNDYNMAEDMYLGKSAIPTFSGGFGLHMDFRGLFLDANVYFAGGHKVYETWSRYTHDNGLYATDFFNGVADLTTSWTEPGQVTDFPKIYYGYNPNFATNISSRFLFDGDYARLKALVFGYNLPEPWVTRIKFNSIQVYIRGTNLLTWVRDDGLKYDPEVKAIGFTNLTTPPVKSVILGVTLNF